MTSAKENSKRVEREDAIKRLVQLDKKIKLKPTERKERERLLDDITVFYNSKKKSTTISGGGLISLWLRYIEGNKKWKQSDDPTVKDILRFERNYNVKLYTKKLGEFKVRQ